MALASARAMQRAAARMSERHTHSPHRMVLDTNVVLDLVVFNDPGIEHIAEAIRSGAALPVTTHECLDELRRVLAYPALKLDIPAQNDALERYRAQALSFETSNSPAAVQLPRCADPDDQKFLELAQHTSARFLLTKDKALLRLARSARLASFEILHPAKFISPT